MTDAFVFDIQTVILAEDIEEAKAKLEDRVRISYKILNVGKVVPPVEVVDA